MKPFVVAKPPSFHKAFCQMRLCQADASRAAEKASDRYIQLVGQHDQHVPLSNAPFAHMHASALLRAERV